MHFTNSVSKEVLIQNLINFRRVRDRNGQTTTVNDLVNHIYSNVGVVVDHPQRIGDNERTTSVLGFVMTDDDVNVEIQTADREDSYIDKEAVRSRVEDVLVDEPPDSLIEDIQNLIYEELPDDNA